MFLSETTQPRTFIFDVLHHLEVLYQYLVDSISGPMQMAPLWPLTFSSVERPRALWAFLFKALDPSLGNIMSKRKHTARC